MKKTIQLLLISVSLSFLSHVVIANEVKTIYKKARQGSYVSQSLKPLNCKQN